MAEYSELFSNLIAAFHILHHKGVIDAYGHVSVRNPLDSSTFFIGTLPANLISSPADLVQIRVLDGSPIANPVGGVAALSHISPFSEHHIHSSIYARYPGVNSVVHGHAPELIAFGIVASTAATAEMPATHHECAFVDSGRRSVPVFNARSHYDSCGQQTHKRNHLINTKCLGDDLAQSVIGDGRESGADVPGPNLVLQQGHGFSTWGTSLEDAVFRAVYARLNARILLDVKLLSGDTSMASCAALEEAETQACEAELNRGMPRAFPSWRMEMRRSGIYVNKLDTSQ